MRAFWSKALITAAALAGLATPAAAAAPHVKIAIGGATCLCYMPTVLAGQLGFYKEAGIDAELIDFKGGSQALTAVVGGSADVVSGYYDHTPELAAKGKTMTAIVVYDRYPGLALVVSPKHTAEVKTLKDLVGHPVGVSASGSSTDFFLKFALRKDGQDPQAVPVVSVGLGGSAVAAMEQGQIWGAVMLDPAITLLQGKYADLRVLVDTRSEADTRKVFGSDYPGGSIYANADWIAAHPTESQALADAIVHTLQWMQGHDPDAIMKAVGPTYVGPDPAQYRAALVNGLPMFSRTGLMDPKGADAVLEVMSLDPAIAAAKVDIAKTYTNRFAEEADRRFGIAH